MNEKIKELAEQATSTHTHLSAGGTFEETTRYFNKEKFAELIIQECIYACGWDYGAQLVHQHWYGNKEYIAIED